MLPYAYLAAVGLIALTRAVTGHPSVADLALTPDELAAGHVWLLATSAAIINGSVVPQLAALALTIVVCVERFGERFSVVVMLVAHVGATLLAYAVLLIASGDADGSHNRSFDYGTSAIWLGLLGALAVDWLRRGRRLPAAAACLTAVAGALLFPLMSALEHAFAFALGAGLAALRESRRPAGRSARSGASTESAPAEAA